MGITVAISAKRDQVLISVVTHLASRANVVHLKTIGTPARPPSLQPRTKDPRRQG
jgi:hypothetical protein